jgi:acetyltransferase-like isoleucine patch superfamily enzyme
LAAFWKTVLLMAYMAGANHVVSRLPVNSLRSFLYRTVYRVKLGKDSVIHMGAFLEKPRRIVIGDHTLVNPRCILDGREGLTIGSNVDIAMEVAIFTLGHDIRDPDYKVKGGPVTIGDRACVFSRATILPGVTVGEGAVVAAGSVVARDVPPYTVVAGNPARKIGDRPRDQRYTLRVCRYFH